MKTIELFPEYSIDEAGTKIFNSRTNKFVAIQDQKIKGKTTGYKYATLWLTTADYACKRIAVHRLVALTYIPNPNNLPEVNHKDRDKGNNNVSNLEWCSHADNIQHSYDNGRKCKSGKDHWNFGKTYSKEHKKAMSDQKLGEKHPKFKGYYCKDGKKYPSSYEAARKTGEVGRTIARQSEKNKNGWSFLPKEKLVQTSPCTVEWTNTKNL